MLLSTGQRKPRKWEWAWDNTEKILLSLTLVRLHEMTQNSVRVRACGCGEGGGVCVCVVGVCGVDFGLFPRMIVVCGTTWTGGEFDQGDTSEQ